MEDFGLLKGTVFDFGKEWTRESDGKIEDCLSEATMETYMNKNGLRYKMNKTDKEREGLKLFGGLLPEISFNVPGLNVDVNIKAPEVESLWEAMGFTATSNNARRVEEKMKAVKKESDYKNTKYKDIVDYWKEKYGYTKYYPGSWFYYVPAAAPKSSFPPRRHSASAGAASTEHPRRGRGAAATRLHGITRKSPPRRRRDPPSRNNAQISAAAPPRPAFTE